MKKILVAEDDIFLNKVYKTKLTLNKYEVRSVYRGDRVMEEVKEYKPDLIILDVIMPGQDGFAVLRDLKSDSETKRIPVMVLTNLSGENDKKSIMALGASKYLTKVNVSIGEVMTEIERQLNS